MRTIGCAVLVCVLAVTMVAATAEEEIAIGDSVARVIEILGPPQGKAGGRQSSIALYPRGTVTFRNGKVAAVNLVTPEEAREAAEQKHRREAERAAAGRKARAARLAEGTEKKAAQLASDTFAQRPAGERLDYWETFRRQYPEVPVDAEIAALQPELDAARKAATDAQKQAALSNQVAAVEKTIAATEARTHSARDWTRRRARRELAELRPQLEELKKQLDTPTDD